MKKFSDYTLKERAFMLMVPIIVVVTLLVHSCMVVTWEEALSECRHIPYGLDKEATEWNECMRRQGH